MNGFIKLHRQLLDWEWYGDINVRLVFIHCLLKANFKDKRWQGQLIKRGQFISSLGKLSEGIGISKQQLRTALEKLKKTGEMTTKGQGNNTLFIVNKYNDYQDFTHSSEDRQQHTPNTPSTHEQHTGNTSITTTEEGKKDKKEEEYIYINQFEKIQKGEVVRSTTLEHHFHFGLFPKEWKKEFINKVLELWRYYESSKGRNWGIVATITSQRDYMKTLKNQYSDKSIIESIDDCIRNGNTRLFPKKDDQTPTKGKKVSKNGNTRANTGGYRLGQKIHNGC